jgi:hypothetical protein
MLPVIEGGCWETTSFLKVAGGFKGEMVEVAPRAACGEDDFGVVWEVKLRGEC